MKVHQKNFNESPLFTVSSLSARKEEKIEEQKLESRIMKKVNVRVSKNDPKDGSKEARTPE